jgi:hypothetical protein
MTTVRLDANSDWKELGCGVWSYSKPIKTPADDDQKSSTKSDLCSKLGRIKSAACAQHKTTTNGKRVDRKHELHQLLLPRIDKRAKMNERGEHGAD